MTDAFSLDDVIGKYANKPSALDKPDLLMFYSVPGGGKTFTAATAADLPDVKHVLYLDTEGSTVGVLNNIKNADKIDVIRVDRHPQPFEFLRALLSKGKQGLFNPKNKTKYDVIILDTLDVAQSWAVEYFVDGGPGTPITKSGDIDTRAGWGLVSRWTLDVAANLKSMDALGILVVHEREEKSETGAVISKIKLQGSAKDTLPGVPDVVAYLTRRLKKGVPVTTAYFGVEDTKVVKDRFHFPPQVDNVTIPALYAMIDANGKTGESDATEGGE